MTQKTEYTAPLAGDLAQAAIVLLFEAGHDFKVLHSHLHGEFVLIRVYNEDAWQILNDLPRLLAVAETST